MLIINNTNLHLFISRVSEEAKINSALSMHRASGHDCRSGGAFLLTIVQCGSTVYSVYRFTPFRNCCVVLVSIGQDVQIHSILVLWKHCSSFLNHKVSVTLDGRRERIVINWF